MFQFLKTSYGTFLLILSSVVVFLFAIEAVEEWYVLLIGMAGLAVLYAALFLKQQLLPAILLLTPLSIKWDFDGYGLSVPSESMILLLGCVFLLKAIYHKDLIDKRVLKHPISLMIFAELAWMVVSACFSEFPLFSFKRAAMRLFFILIGYLLMAEYFREKPKHILHFYWLYAIGCVLPVLRITFVQASYYFKLSATAEITKPFFADHTIYGASLAFIIVPILIHFAHLQWSKVRFRYLLGMIFVLGVLGMGEFFSWSRAAWLSLAVSAVFGGLLMLRISFGQLMTALSLSILLAIYYAPEIEVYFRNNDAQSANREEDLAEHLASVTNITSDVSNTERINRYNCALRMFEARPIFGFGPGTFQEVYGKFQAGHQLTRISTRSGNRGNGHSEYLEPLAERGLFGFLTVVGLRIIALFYAMKLYYAQKNPRKRMYILMSLLGMMTFFFHGIFNTFSDQDKIAILFFGSLAVLVAVDLFQEEAPVFEDLQPLT